MKKTYIIPEACIADICQQQILALSYENKSAQKGNTTYTVGDEMQEYESDGY